MCCIQAVLLAELLCGRRPQEWSPILILKGMLVILYGPWQAEWLAGVRAVRPSHFMTFLHEANFRPDHCQWRACELSVLTWQTGR